MHIPLKDVPHEFYYIVTYTEGGEGSEDGETQQIKQAVSSFKTKSLFSASEFYKWNWLSHDKKARLEIFLQEAISSMFFSIIENINEAIDN